MPKDSCQAREGQDQDDAVRRDGVPPRESLSRAQRRWESEFRHRFQGCARSACVCMLNQRSAAAEAMTQS